jgi:hypothetical protein
MTRTLSRPARERDRTQPYLAILLQRSAFGNQVHAGLAKYGVGKAFCDDRQRFEFAHPMQDPRFSLTESDGWRHRYAEAYLELNRGCVHCLEILYAIGREAGYGAHAQVRDQ